MIWVGDREFDRRDFLRFFGQTALAAGLATSPALGLMLGGCATPAARRLKAMEAAGPLPFTPLSPTDHDELVLAPGLEAQVLISWNEVLNTRGDRFGYNNDYTALIALDHPERNHGVTRDALLWVNHEYPNPLFVSGYDPLGKSGNKHRTREQVLQEQLACGGTILRVRQNAATGRWSWVYDDAHNRRITAQTPIPIISDRPIQGRATAIGTVANCGGGVTPWGTVLSCEENYDEFYAERPEAKIGARTKKHSLFGWEEFFDYPAEHYGWVVEIAPRTGMARKLTSLGRFAHESATVTTAPDKRAVVYMGDDADDQFIYKFVASERESLTRGTLYVADTQKGRWLALSVAEDPRLAKVFADQTELLVHTRKAAEIVGATPQDRPEDMDIDARTGQIYVALTKNNRQGRPFGSILKITEKGNDPRALEFEAQTFIPGGPNTGLACPDNLAFDPRGNLWMATDISRDSLGQGAFASLGNNALHYIPIAGPHAGRLFQIASGPTQSEITGMTFTPNGRSLFLSVQHPGEDTVTLAEPTSHWPDGGDATPRPAVVVIQGELLNRLSSIH